MPKNRGRRGARRRNRQHPYNPSHRQQQPINPAGSGSRQEHNQGQQQQHRSRAPSEEPNINRHFRASAVAPRVSNGTQVRAELGPEPRIKQEPGIKREPSIEGGLRIKREPDTKEEWDVKPIADSHRNEEKDDDEEDDEDDAASLIVNVWRRGDTSRMDEDDDDAASLIVCIGRD